MEKAVELLIIMLIVISGLLLFIFYSPEEVIQKVVETIFFSLFTGYVIGKILRA